MATVYLKLALGSLRGLVRFICFLSTESAALNAESGPVTNPVLVAASGWEGVKPRVPSLPQLQSLLVSNRLSSRGQIRARISGKTFEALCSWGQ